MSLLSRGHAFAFWQAVRFDLAGSVSVLTVTASALVNQLFCTLEDSMYVLHSPYLRVLAVSACVVSQALRSSFGATAYGY